MKKIKHWIVASSLVLTSFAWAKTVRYELTITQQSANLSGAKMVDFPLMVNGTIPAPTLEFTEGDEAEIVVKNGLKGNEEVSTHWHGLLLPPEMDGVAYVNTPPIFPGHSHAFRFKIRQHGTFWYHSHTHYQEQKGIYGAFVIHPKKETIKYDKEAVVVLSDWSDENPDQILSNLRKDGDYYLYKKKTIRSWFGAIHANSLGTFLNNEWTRMGGMDLSDVGYDAFLINGKRDSQLLNAKAGEKVRLRIINAGASSYFYVSLGQAPMKVISADGTNIEPVLAKDVRLGMAETIDVLFEVPENKNYELKATAQDVTGSASAWIGNGEKVFAPVKPAPDLYATMDHGAHAGHGGQSGHEGHKMDHSQMDHSKMNHSQTPSVDMLTVDDMKALAPTEYSEKLPRYEVKLALGGDMSRYIWHINGKAIHQDQILEIKEGDVVRFTFENGTMMHHPMHLHGHFFRVLNKNAAFSPMKHTVDVPPHGSRTIEFYANEPGQWMLHCHNLFHMHAGMARVVKYSSFTPAAEIAGHQKHDPHLHDHLYYAGELGAFTNLGAAKIQLSKTWDTLETKIEAKKDDEWTADGDLFYRHWLDNYLNIVAGGTRFHGEDRGLLGLGYTLPMLVYTNLLIDSRAKIRVDLLKEFQWTDTLSSEIEVKIRQDEGAEFGGNLMYANSWAWAFGLMLTDHSLGVGGRFRF